MKNYTNLKCGITPENISSLNANEVFVFGSNLGGFHAGGAAAFAMKRFGAVWGVGVGLQGQSYAIPTMHGGVDVIKPYVDQFIEFAKENPGKHFYVTKIGCGIAGFTTDEISPLFKKALALPNVSLPVEFIFDKFNNRPLWQSYEVPGNGIFYAGEYPGDVNAVKAEQKIRRMVNFGIKHFVDLTEKGELMPYSHLLPEGCTYLRFPIQDVGAPKSVESVHHLLYHIDEMKKQGGYVYLHCWGGVGRTGTIVACHLARFLVNPTLDGVLMVLRDHFKAMPKSAHRVTPESKEQVDFIARFIESVLSHSNKN